MLIICDVVNKQSWTSSIRWLDFLVGMWFIWGLKVITTSLITQNYTLCFALVVFSLFHSLFWSPAGLMALMFLKLSLVYLFFFFSFLKKNIILNMLCYTFWKLHPVKHWNDSYLWEEWKERQKEAREDISSKFLNLRFVSLEVLPLVLVNYV